MGAGERTTTSPDDRPIEDETLTTGADESVTRLSRRRIGLLHDCHRLYPPRARLVRSPAPRSFTRAR
jgi:hypothetical protein